MTERDRIVDDIYKVIAEELGEEGALHPPYDPDCLHLPYIRAADKVLRVIEAPKPTDYDEILHCTCDHNGYGTYHRVGCELSPICGIQDLAGDGRIAGTCELPKGHGRWHQEWRDGKLWAEWSGGVVPARMSS